jgi:hypothetical protein
VFVFNNKNTNFRLYKLILLFLLRKSVLSIIFFLQNTKMIDFQFSTNDIEFSFLLYSKGKKITLNKSPEILSVKVLMSNIK